jgi:hypothetical protein
VSNSREEHPSRCLTQGTLQGFFRPAAPTPQLPATKLSETETVRVHSELGAGRLHTAARLGNIRKLNLNRSAAATECGLLADTQYDRINNLLHAHYALGGLPRCVAEGGEALEQCLAALRASPPKDRFVGSAPYDDATVEQLIDLLPPTLGHLELIGVGMTAMPVGRQVSCASHAEPH